MCQLLAKRNFKKILDVLHELGVVVTNEDQIFSRRAFNSYFINYSTLYNQGDLLRSTLLIETYCHNSSFPIVIKPISNYIYQLLEAEKIYEASTDFPDLTPFEMNVQSLERTFVDKLFVVCDKYFFKTPERNSRHLYV